uniref:Secreted protein n=1 Tax=Haemonchus contortus TaxID=6289 RepID=A0A7I4XUA7_HAECO
MKSILILLIVAFAVLATSVDSHEGTHHAEGSGSHEGTHHAEGSGSHEGTHHAETHSGSKTKRAIPSSLEDNYNLKARVKRHASSEENGTHHPGGHKPKRATS